jgi:cytidine deaminase
VGRLVSKSLCGTSAAHGLDGRKVSGEEQRVPSDDGDRDGAAAAVDWTALRAAATAACGTAYAPYSRFPVGAAGLVDDGRVVRGCNVENASFGLTLCAECGLVSDLVASGGGRLVAVACVGADGLPLMPCGRCRQLLWEHGGAAMLLETAARGVVPLAEVLPDAFGPDDLGGHGAQATA